MTNLYAAFAGGVDWKEKISNAWPLSTPMLSPAR